MLDVNMCLRNMSDFVSFSLFGFTLVIKLRNVGFESHWNSLICFDKKGLRFDMVRGKMSGFVSIPLFGFTLVIKLRNSDFESHWNFLICFDQKDMLSD